MSRKLHLMKPRPPTRPRVAIGWHRSQLDRDDLTLTDLRSLKDSLLAAQEEDPSVAPQIGTTLARIKLRIADHYDRARAESAATWPGIFVEVAKRLLAPEVVEMIVRETDRVAGDRNSPAATEPVPRLPQIGGAPAAAKKGPAPQPRGKAVTPPLPPKPIATVAEIAAPKMMPFDPARLYQEFGREHVLGTWSQMDPKSAPTTASGFREELIRRRVNGFLAPVSELAPREGR